MSRLLLIIPVLLVWSAALPADEEPSLPPDVRWLVMGDAGSVRLLNLRLELNGQPLSQVWAKAFDQLYLYHDRNGDGRLSVEEASRLPSPYALRQLLWNPVSQFQGQVLRGSELDQNGDTLIDRVELANFYRRHGSGGATIGAGLAPATEALNSALIRQLDTSSDEVVSTAEWEQAGQTLSRLDANTDEFITPEELVPRLTYPGTSGSHWWRAGEPLNRQHPVTQQLPLRLLPALDAEFASQLEIAPETSRFIAPEPTAPAETLHWKPGDTPSRRRLHLDRIHLVVLSQPGQLSRLAQETAERVRNRFRSADTNADGSLDRTETGKKDQSDLRALFPVADLNADGCLTAEELRRWIALQEQLAAVQVQVSVLDFRRGLFELLDGDNDGRLSLRELRDTANVIQSAGLSTVNRFDSGRLPLQVRLIISQGQPQPPQPLSPAHAPGWFQAMDRNRDGDLSPREFIGTPEIFQQLDRNADGLLTPEEAVSNPAK